MAVRSQDLASLIRQQIESFEAPQRMVNVGTVVEVGDGIAQVAGLANAAASELVEFPSGTLGIVFNLQENLVGVIIMGEYSDIEEGDLVRATGRIVSVPVGDAMIGRVDQRGGPAHRRQRAYRHRRQVPPGGAYCA